MIILVFIIGGVLGYYFINNNLGTLPTSISKHTSDGKYIIKKFGKVLESVETKDEAIEKAQQIQRSIVINKNNNEWVYSSLQPFLIITDTAIHDFDTFENAISYAKKNGHNEIYYNNDSVPIWSNQLVAAMEKPLEVPLIMQLPELRRGCEVTSLAMIFQYYGKNIGKMQLAEEIKKDPTEYRVDEEGRKYYGNPYDGFVGDMYNGNKNGYGVYHPPIAELAKTYFGDKVVDLTDLEFNDLLYFVSAGYPVWAIANSTYKALDDSYFEIWHTPTGIVKITKKLHAVVITGFDEEKVYINDPLYANPNRPVNRKDFEKAWEQMGNQGVTIIK